jgi:uncharacterized protein (TIGR02757 family)
MTRPRAGRLGTGKTDSLKQALDRLYIEFDRSGVVRDPVELVRPYPDPADREIAAFCAAALAFGRVASIMASVAALLRVMGPRPADFVRGFEPARHEGPLLALVHRWTRGRDFVALLWILRQMIETSGSLERFFAASDDSSAPDIRPGLEQFCVRARGVDLRPAYGQVPARPGVHIFFPRPSSGSACKRLNLFLRWMVRRDQVDPGGWTLVARSRLVIPLDVHVVRVGRCIGLTGYSSPGWRMAADITASLRELDPEDPVRYDFALCHLGMLNACGFNQPAGDQHCPLRGVCRPHPRKQRASRRPSARR